ncbi:MAG: transporter [Pirellulaceae bacterium]
MNPHSAYLRRRFLCWSTVIAVLAIGGAIDRRAVAQTNAPGTLFQWSYGANFEGGPDLDAPLVTDRPDFTEASSTVGVGVTQLEMGYTYTYRDHSGANRGHSIGEPLFRVGALANWFEMRLGWNYMHERQDLASSTSRLSGLDDLYLGAKIGLTPQEGFLPEMALIPQMTVPVGDVDHTAGEVLPGVNWIYGWDINEFLGTAGSTQINRVLDGTTSAAYYEIAQSWTFGYTLTDRLGAYTEWFALMPSGADTDRTQHYLNGGFTYLMSDNVQLDVRAGKGLSGTGDDYFLGTGASLRFGAGGLLRR